MKININKKDKIYLSIIAILMVAIAVISVAWALSVPVKKENDPLKAYYNNKCSSYATQNVNLAKGQIVFVGDSITDLCPLDDYYADLDLACYNRGIGGDTTDGVLRRLKVSIFDIKPSKIVLMIGTNDVDGGKNNAYIVANYRKILDEIKENQPKVELFFMSVIPQNKDFENASGLNVTENNRQIVELNSEIAKLCDEYGYTYINIYNSLLGEDGYLDKKYSDDGLHLNANGFVVWSNALKPLLEEK